jgi:hypothetical protein
MTKIITPFNHFVELRGFNLVTFTVDKNRIIILN